MADEIRQRARGNRHSARADRDVWRKPDEIGNQRHCENGAAPADQSNPTSAPDKTDRIASESPNCIRQLDGLQRLIQHGVVVVVRCLDLECHGVHDLGVGSETNAV